MWFILSAGPAFDSSGQKPFYAQIHSSRGISANPRCGIPLHERRLRAQRITLAK
jgi:hypothetical protein